MNAADAVNGVPGTEQFVRGPFRVNASRRARPNGSIWFLHGIGDSPLVWRGGFSSAALSDFDLFAPTLPGCDNTARLPGAPPLEAIADQLGQLLEATTGAPVVIVGHSLGGVLATLIADRAEFGVAGLISVEGNLSFGDTGVSSRYGAAAAAEDTFRTWLDEYRASFDRGSAGPVATHYRATLARVDPTTFRSACLDLVRLSSDSAIGVAYTKLDVARLYVSGRRMPPESRAILDDHGLAYVIYEEAEHWVMLDAPERFYHDVATFAARVVEEEAS